MEFSSLHPRRYAFALLTLMTVMVGSVAHAAVKISGHPQGWIRSGKVYTFQPSVSGASGTVTFSIANKPRWASFDPRTGRLSGQTREADAGTYMNIAISARDSKSSSRLGAYNLRVAPRYGTLTITGTAPATAFIGRAYSFRPKATDSDGDKLTFSIANKPSWARFDSGTGILSGTPAASGKSNNIIISVTDGKSTVSLAGFSVSVGADVKGSAVVRWSTPTRNVDGSSLTNLAGYRVLYGTDPNKLNQTLQLNDPKLLSVEIEELSAGMNYFAVKAYTSSGSESELSEVVWKLIE